jgi:hypothetical protein
MELPILQEAGGNWLAGKIVTKQAFIPLWQKSSRASLHNMRHNFAVWWFFRRFAMGEIHPVGYNPDLS